MKRYNPKEIEPKWQKIWADKKIYEASEDATKPKKYVLEYFPYPSGAAMHVGHVRNYTIGDAISRHDRMRGQNVLHPMGWDAFGLPAENFAIKTGKSPKEIIAESTKRFKQQLIQMGFGYDWSREINSSDPRYYKWTQWFFELLFKKGLAYQEESLQWWCPVDKTVLANEQVENGKCWRCGSIVEKKALKQWFFKITDYADRLDKDLENLYWSESIKSMQHNWIGRSSGVEVKFPVEKINAHIEAFTTRPDTIYGATFLVLAPEHSLVQQLITPEYKQKVENYLVETINKSDIDRMETNREKTGVFTGSYAVNPMSGRRIPIWVADYILIGYGTGAIMAVPAHDARDWEFAKRHQLPIIPVVVPNEQTRELDEPFTGEGVLINSNGFDGMSSSEAREKIVQALVQKALGVEKTNYKMRDWLISRQRYWGAPIPIIHCPTHGAVPVPEKDLPVTLPDIKSYEPTGDGRSPLARIPEFVNTTCPICGEPAQRETDTMDGFACSSWYFLRFADPHNKKAPFAKNKVDFWLPVDDYIGGAEHAVMHLLYARFWTKVMYDEKMIDFSEPFLTLRNQGMILAPDGQKMSKSKGNTIEPDVLIEQGYGADSIRIMELFIGPWNQMANWSVEGMGGAYRFLQRVWVLVQEYKEATHNNGSDTDQALRRATHRTIKRVSQDIEQLGFNTAIAALMEFVNQLYQIKAADNYSNVGTWQFAIESLLKLLAPFAPHISEELWQQMGKTGSIHESSWPSHDESLLTSDNMTIVIQVNGKLRAQMELPVSTPDSEVVELAKREPKVQPLLSGAEIKKSIYVPNKLVNFVTN